MIRGKNLTDPYFVFFLILWSDRKKPCAYTLLKQKLHEKTKILCNKSQILESPSSETFCQGYNHSQLGWGGWETVAATCTLLPRMNM